MNKIRFSIFAAAVALLMTAGGLHAQTSIQNLAFSLIGEYQTDFFSTNASGALTNEATHIHQILIATGNVVKALAVDLEGTNWTNWAGARLVREVNLTNGNEGIFLRLNGRQTNVSSFFGGSFSNNFTGELTNAFPALNPNLADGLIFTNVVTNLFTNAATNIFTNTITNTVTDSGSNYVFTNLFTNVSANVFTNLFTNAFNNAFNNSFSNSFNLDTPLVHGTFLLSDSTDTTTNITTTGGLYFVSLNTTNLKFNLMAVGNGSVTQVSGANDERAIESQLAGAAGAFYLNTSTNIFDARSNPPVYLAGVLRGTLSTGQPSFIPTNSLP
ncbi:MAG: hypothetical protein ACLQU4_20845 [Limisphaerales bacterium]